MDTGGEVAGRPDAAQGGAAAPEVDIAEAGQALTGYGYTESVGSAAPTKPVPG